MNLKYCFVDDTGLVASVKAHLLTTAEECEGGEHSKNASASHSLRPPQEFNHGNSLAAVFAVWMSETCRDPPIDQLPKPDDSITQTWCRYATDSTRFLFFVRANAKITGHRSRHDCEGIEFLRHIRLTSDLPSKIQEAHFIVYSSESLGAILRRKPENLILCTTGVTFLRLPEMLESEMTASYLTDKAEVLADLASEQFRSAIRASYRPPDSAHALANWWGVRQLIEGAYEVHGTPLPPLPISVQNHMHLLSSKEAMFLSKAHRWNSTNLNVEDDELDSIEKLRARFADPDFAPKIVYVDDQLGDGWYEAVHYALSGRATSADSSKWLVPMQMTSYDGSDGQLAKCGKVILDHNPALVITDLRLMGSREALDSFDTSSGASLIKLLRRDAPALPLLLMTASNRSDSAQHAQRIGTDAFWTKEGIGERSSPDGIKRHAADLILRVERLLGDDYGLLRMMDSFVAGTEIRWNGTPYPGAVCINKGVKSKKQERIPWWKVHKWPDVPKDHPLADQQKLMDILVNTQAEMREIKTKIQNIMRMYREYLRVFTMFEAAPMDVESFWIRNLCVQAGLVVEAIHQFRKLKYLSSRGEYANNGTVGSAPYRKEIDPLTKRVINHYWGREDWLGAAIYEVRNHAAHSTPDERFRRGREHLVLRALVHWLRVCTPNWGHSHNARVRLLNLIEAEITSTNPIEEAKAALDNAIEVYHPCVEKNLEKAMGARWP